MCNIISSLALSEFWARIAFRIMLCSSAAQFTFWYDLNRPTINEVCVIISHTVLKITWFPVVLASLMWNSAERRMISVRLFYLRAVSSSKIWSLRKSKLSSVITFASYFTIGGSINSRATKTSLASNLLWEATYAPRLALWFSDLREAKARAEHAFC